MKLRAVIALVLCSIPEFYWAQQTTLPIVKEGRWYLRKNNAEIALPESYSYVNTFDSKGYAYFQHGGTYGIVSEKGEEMVRAEFRDIIPMGNGYFKCQRDTVQLIIYWNGKETEYIDCKQSVKLEEHWYFLETVQAGQRQEFLLNTTKAFTIPIDSTVQYRTAFDHVVFDEGEGKYKLYDEAGEKLFEGKATVNYDFDYGRVFSEQFNYVFDNFGGKWNFPPAARFIDVSKEYIQYKLGKTAYLLNRESKKELFSCTGDQIWPLRGNYRVLVNDRNGIMNSAKKWLIEPKYDYFEFTEQFIVVSYNTLIGYYDLKFREVVPCKYKSISMDSAFFYTQSVSGYEGLISRKTGKEILPAVYDKIVIKNGLIKAWANGNLLLVELTANHGLKNKLVLENIVSLRSKERVWKNFNFDPRLFALGWYYDSVRGNASNLWPNSNYKWGLKNEKDSIIVKPTYSHAVFVPGAGFTLMSQWINPEEAQKIPASRVMGRCRYKYRLVDYTKGKMLPTEPLEYLDTTDLMFRSFTRFRDTTGHGVVFKDNAVRRFSHLDLSADEFVRYSVGGDKHYVERKSAMLLSFQNVNLWQSYYFNFPPKWNPKWLGYEINGGKWNFLTPEGDSLFAESFDFAEPFHKKTAIVYKHKRWGVVSKDTLVIPLMYNSIKRIKEYKDTVFLVGVSSGKQLLMDTNLRIISSENFVFEDKKGALIHVKEQKKNVVLSEEGTRIYETEKSIKWHDFNRMVIRENKAFSIVDERGQTIGEVHSKPENFLDANAFVAKNVSKLGVLSLYEDTLIPFEFKTIESCRNYIIAQASGKSCLYNSEFELIKCVEGAQLLVDSVSGLWAASFPEKVVIYDEKGKVIRKIKSNNCVFQLFYNSCLFSSSNKTEALRVDGSWMNLKQKKTDCSAFGDGFFGIEFENKYWKIYDRNWKMVSGAAPELKRPFYTGDGVLAGRSEGKMVLLDGSNGTSYPGLERIDDIWQDELLLVKKTGRYYPFQFLDRSFANAFHRDFIEASAFAFGFASVCDERGCTLINKQGYQKSYPSFNPMKVLGPNLVSTTEKMKYGILDSQGHTILKPEFERITFLNGGIIQAVQDGNIRYFDMQGKVVY